MIVFATFLALSAWAGDALEGPRAGEPPASSCTFVTDGAEETARCSGVLLSPSIALTAAHCVLGSNATNPLIGKVRVRCGNKKAVKRSLVGLQAHPDYDRKNRDRPQPNDVAVYRIQPPLEEGAQPRIVKSVEETKTLLRKGKCWFVGIGSGNAPRVARTGIPRYTTEEMIGWKGKPALSATTEPGDSGGGLYCCLDCASAEEAVLVGTLSGGIPLEEGVVESFATDLGRPRSARAIEAWGAGKRLE